MKNKISIAFILLFIGSVAFALQLSGDHYAKKKVVHHKPAAKKPVLLSSVTPCPSQPLNYPCDTSGNPTYTNYDEANIWIQQDTINAILRRLDGVPAITQPACPALPLNYPCDASGNPTYTSYDLANIWIQQDSTIALLRKFTGGGGSGTVTSVALSMPSVFQVSGSPITTSGTISVSPTNSTGYLFNNAGTLSWATVGGGTVTQVNSGFGLQGGPITTTGTIRADTTRAAKAGLPTIWFVDSVSALTIAKGWSLVGNNGTTPGTNFLGTMDNQPIEFKANNTWEGYIGTTNNNIFWGNTSGVNFGSSSYNVAIGYQTASLNLLGIGIVALGSTTMKNSKSGANYNLGIGSACLYNSNGDNNTGIGAYSGYNTTTGDRNIFIGDSTGITNITGNYNTLIGYQANVSTSALTNSTAIGKGAIDSASNEIKLGNNSIATVRLGSGAYCLPIQVSTLTSGTVTCNGNEILRLTGAASALTIAMPTPVSGMLLIISTNQTSIALSFGTGANFDITPTVVTKSAPIRLYYDPSTATWANW